MKSNRAIKVLTIIVIILIIILLSCISFFGILQRNLNSWKNILPEYSLSKELSGMRVFSFNVDKSMKEVEADTEEETTSDENVEDSVEVDQTVSTDSESSTDEQTDTSAEAESTTDEQADGSTETENTTTEVPVNDESVLTAENYEKTKDIIQKRFQAMGISDYNIRLNNESGKIQIEMPYEESTDYAIDLVTSVGKVEIVDSDTEEILMDNSYIKSATAYYTQSSSTTTTTTSGTALDLGIQLDFTKEGLNKLSEISKTYVETIDSEGESQIKSITIRIDDEDRYKTYFSTEGNYTYLAIPLYQGISDDEIINEDYIQCIIIQNAINGGELPIVYTLDAGSYIESPNKTNIIKALAIAFIVIVAIIILYFILKYRKKGIFASILEIGFIAVLLLMIRIANVTLTFTGLISILIATLLNLYFIILMLHQNENRYLSSIGKFLLNTLPLIIIMIVFNFASTLQLQSIGMILFWGFLITIIYNLIFSKFVLDFCDNENGKGAEE